MLALSCETSRQGGGGNWRTSIVELLEMLDMDSTPGRAKDGKVPDSLKH